MPHEEIPKHSVEKLAEVLAILVAEGNYTYVDKLANAPSVDLAVFYLREAIRDFHSLIRQQKLKNENVKKLLDIVIKELGESEENILGYLNSAIDKVHEYCNSDPKKLREVCSLIGAKALAISAKYIGTRSGGE